MLEENVRKFCKGIMPAKLLSGDESCLKALSMIDKRLNSDYESLKEQLLALLKSPAGQNQEELKKVREKILELFDEADSVLN